MTDCYKIIEKRKLWGHIWSLCHVFTHKEEAVEAKQKCQGKGYHARLQAIRHMGGTVYLLWRRK